ncbi:MAG: hypothetical protein Q7T74_07610 [Candidatus Saccharibacteria bacterium]|nr:hypothetical protein [Candidatus Saccharibacteria bacterium]
MENDTIVNKRNISFLLIIFFVIGLVVSIFGYINSQQTVSVKYKNISKVTIQKIGQGSKSLGKETVYKKSGEKITLMKGSYLLKYTGIDGYASDYENINLNEKPVFISLDPDYSNSRLSSILEDNFEDIKIILNAKYKNMSDYNIQKGKLYKKGQWYGTTLQYSGNDVFNYDTLRLVMEKKGDTWRLVTSPPNIILSSKDYPNIPVDVLRDVNNVQNTMFVQKYTDPNSKVYFP